MDKVLSFFGNRWTKLGFSFLSLGYGAFLIFLAWLTFSHYLVAANPASLFSLYLFINVFFGVIMFYTRKQVLTQIVACLLHPCILVTLIFAFGNWALIIPPFIVATVVFFAANSSEVLKTVLGTIYLILFVLGILGYLTLQTFTIKLFTVDLNLRSPDYLYSPDKTYRVVKYIDDENKENRMVSYYVEPANEDLHLWFLDCEKFYGAVKVHAARYQNQPQIKWLNETKLLVDGKVKDILAGGAEEDDDEDDFSGETAILTTPASMTKVSETAPVIDED